MGGTDCFWASLDELGSYGGLRRMVLQFTFGRLVQRAIVLSGQIVDAGSRGVDQGHALQHLRETAVVELSKRSN